MDPNLCMLKYYKKHIFLLKTMLDKLDPSNDDFTPLLNIQRYIIDRIVNTEKKIKRKRDELSTLKKLLKNRNNNKEKSKEIKSKIKKANESISGYKYLLYLWRCFGDGIAFKYISKWNLKRFLYEDSSPNIKQSSGFLAGKVGMELEWNYVESAAQHKVPAMLCDITNSIRHGDVCLLGASDPHVIEVKSSGNRNRRTARQIESISNIHSYLENDEGDIGGLEGMRRVDISLEEEHHNASINRVIDSARKGKYLRVSPEPGLYYIGLNTEENVNYDQIFGGISEPVLYMLNQHKTAGRWDNYYPFTLSISTSESLYSFISGAVYLIVVIDGSIMKTMSQKMGYELNITMTEDIGLVFTKDIEGVDEPFVSIASEHYVGRLGLEFMSLKWFFEHEKKLLAGIEEDYLDMVKDN